MLIFTEMERISLREVALKLLLEDNKMRDKIQPYVERLDPDFNAKSKHGKGGRDHHSKIHRFFNRLSKLRFSTGSYASSDQIHNSSRLNRSSGSPRKQFDKPLDGRSNNTADNTSSPQIVESTGNHVFGATLKRCIANEILAERKRLMRLERLNRQNCDQPHISTNDFQQSHQQSSSELGSNNLGKKRQLCRRSSVNGGGFGCNRPAARKAMMRRPQPVLIDARKTIDEDIMTTDDADSGFQDDYNDTSGPSVKASSFDTGRRFERCGGDASCPMPLQVPQFVKKCVRHIETYGMDTEGIFRTAPRITRIKQEKCRIQRSVDSEFTGEHTVHDAAALLKEFFRDLPEPLLTRYLYDAFVFVGSKLFVLCFTTRVCCYGWVLISTDSSPSITMIITKL